MEQPWKGWPYEREQERDTGAGILVGHLIFGLAGGLIGWGLAHLPGCAARVCDVALKAVP